MKKQTISVVLATHNEEKNIGDCLESIKDLADEIVIVDGESSDRTREIAEGFGAKIIKTTNKANFHINKQKGIDEAKCDWIFQLDADEHSTKDLNREISDRINDTKQEEMGYWMPRKNFFLGRFLMKGGQYPDYTLRLYRRGMGKLPMKDVHEQAVVEGKVGHLRHPLLHYPYSDFSHYYRKWTRYNDFFARQIKEQLNGKALFIKLFYAILYLIVKPAHWFLTTYFRHKGFMDSWQGFVFSLFSALRFPVSYIKYLSL
ncbi:MAG TPA: glycosyltransferase family 2 protein [Patescibacteria group bacterium]|nr:glycosyltransferase family 2 protein [Patescibacteria group bacterium]